MRPVTLQTVDAARPAVGANRALNRLVSLVACHAGRHELQDELVCNRLVAAATPLEAAGFAGETVAAAGTQAVEERQTGDTGYAICIERSTASCT